MNPSVIKDAMTGKVSEDNHAKQLLEQVKTYLMALQDTICAGENDGKAKFVEDNWQRAEGGGGHVALFKVAISLSRAG